MDVIIDRFRHEDQPVVEQLIQDGLRERWGDDFDPAFNQDVLEIQGNYVNAGAVVLVARVDGRIVATGTLRIDGLDGEIVRMSVASTHRRRGLARTMVEALVESARAHNLERVRVATDTPWRSAVALYRSTGFTEVGTDETDTHFERQLTQAPRIPRRQTLK